MTLPKAYGLSRGWPIGGGQIIAAPTPTPTPGPTPTPVPTGTRLANFDTLTDFPNLGSASAALDPTYKVEGVSAVRFTPGNATLAAPTVGKTLSNFDVANSGVWAFYLNLGQDYARQTIVGATLRMQLNATGTLYSVAAVSGLSTGGNGQKTGGVWVSGSIVRTPSAVTSAAPGNHRPSIALTSDKAKTFDVTLDALYYGVGGQGAIIHTWDDAFVDQATTVSDIHDVYEMHAVAFPPSSQIGGSAKLTAAQLRNMETRRWQICPNLTRNDAAFSDGFASPAEVVADTEACRAELLAMGLTRVDRNTCYTFGGMRKNTDPRIEVASATTTAGNATIPIANTTGIAVGQLVDAYGIPATSRVQSIVANTSVTVTEAPTVGGTIPISFVTDSSPFFGNALPNALRGAGYKWARGIEDGDVFVQFGISPDTAIMCPAYNGASLTLTQYQAILQRVIDNKSLAVIYYHRCKDPAQGETVDNNILPAVYESHCAAYAAARTAGQVYDATFAIVDQKFGNATVPA